jgi:hypothetical protein
LLLSAAASSHTTAAAAVTRAHQRQRGDGSDPVGVSSRTKPMQAANRMKLASPYTATYAAAGTAPGRASSP